MLLLLPGECDPGRIPGIAAALPRPGRVTAPRCQPGLLPIPGDNPSTPSGFPRDSGQDRQTGRLSCPLAGKICRILGFTSVCTKPKRCKRSCFYTRRCLQIPDWRKRRTRQAGTSHPVPSSKLLLFLPLPQNVFSSLLYFSREHFAVNRQNLFWTHSELLPIRSICQHDSDFFFPGYSGLSPACGRPAASPRGDVGL